MSLTCLTHPLQIPGDVFKKLVASSDTIAVRCYQIIAASLAYRHGNDRLRSKTHNEMLRLFR